MSFQANQQVTPSSVIKTAGLHSTTNPVVTKTSDRTLLDRLELERSNNSLATENPIAATQKLLNKAIVLARRDVTSSRRPPTLTSTRWVWRLAAFYHLCHFTPRLMREASQHFASANRQSLARWAKQKAKEETGHDRLALLDIQSMGYRAEAVVGMLVPPAAKTLVDYFTQSAQNSDPIDCVGYSYTAERLGICIGEGYIHSVEALLPPDINATRCLRAHSVLSTEIEHVKETVAMVAELSLGERDRVAEACYRAAWLRFSPPQEAYISDEEIQNVLKPLKLSENHT
jgi:pyrroloquinoline quinone (PQQ) biosynthesis protein C